MRMLIIRPGAIGDVLLAFPVISALRAQYANPHVTLVSNPALLPLARACGIAEETSDYAAAQWSELFLTPGRVAARGDSRLRAALRGMDMAVCWLKDPDGLVEHNLRAAGVERCVVAPGRPPTGERIHIVEYLALTALGRGQASSLPYTLRLPDASGNGSEPASVAVHPGSGGVRKCWPVAYFAAIIEASWRRQIPVLLLAGPADHERLRDLRALLTPPPHSSLLTTLVETPLLEVARRLQQCRGYVGNDSGITHLAALLGVPTVAIFGASDPAVWRPPGAQVTVLFEPVLEHLSPDRVLASMEAWLSH